MIVTRTHKELRHQITKYIDESSNSFISISHFIHDNPELGNEEFKASKILIDILEKEGFSVTSNVAGHQTAFIARKRSKQTGAFTIGFLAEYDALPGLGHACGHNIIGTASVAAAIALSKVLDDIGGEIVVLGTPAEEGGPNGSAKGSFVKHQLLDGIDACMMIHPANQYSITCSSLAVDPLDFEFIGKSAHASAKPFEGINALDAVIQLFNGINALRQHVEDDVRIHGIITHGGDAPNIIPEYAKARFYIRASTREKLDIITNRVKAIAEGAALATGTKLNIIAFQNSIDNLLLNPIFDQIFKESLESLGTSPSIDRQGGIGSTDAGNISQVVPTIHPYIKIGDDHLVPHTPEFREAAKSHSGDAALILGSKALALTGFRLLTEKNTMKLIHQTFIEQKRYCS